jgi:hypothetical protein
VGWYVLQNGYSNWTSKAKLPFFAHTPYTPLRNCPTKIVEAFKTRISDENADFIVPIQTSRARDQTRSRLLLDYL